MFTTVFRDRECLRCGAKYRCDFQIKTGDDICTNYKDGDLVKDGEFDGCKGEHRATYSPICGVCEAFMNREIDELREAAKSIILGSGCEVRESAHTCSLFKGGRRIGELNWGTLCTVNRGTEFLKIEKKVIDRWTRQIRSAAMDGYARIECGWEKLFWTGAPKMEYRVRVSGPYYCTAAKVRIGKRFKIKIVEPNTKDPSKYLQACQKEGK